MSRRDDILDRILVLEDLILDGTDDLEYCLHWVGIHSKLLLLHDKHIGRG